MTKVFEYVGILALAQRMRRFVQDVEQTKNRKNNDENNNMLEYGAKSENQVNTHTYIT